MSKILIAVLAIAAFTTAADAKIWKGKWPKAGNSTLEFRGNKVQYCHKGSCVRRNIFSRKSLSFTWGNSKFKFRRTGNVYKGGFTNGNNSGSITLR